MRPNLDEAQAPGYIESALKNNRLEVAVDFNQAHPYEVSITVYDKQKGSCIYHEDKERIDILYKRTLFDYLTIVREWLEEKGYDLQSWDKTYKNWPIFIQ